MIIFLCELECSID